MEQPVKKKTCIFSVEVDAGRRRANVCLVGSVFEGKNRGGQLAEGQYKGLFECRNPLVDENAPDCGQK